MVTRDARLVTTEDAAEYAHFLALNGGFAVPGFYYQNHARDAAFSRTGIERNGGWLHMPTLMITARNDRVCTPEISAGLERWCTKLSRAQVCPPLYTFEHLVGENIHRYPMSLTSLECPASKLVNSDTRPRPTLPR